jgi:hypothetical protein
MTDTFEMSVKVSESKIEPSVLLVNDIIALEYARKCKLSLREAAEYAGVRRVDVFNYWSNNVLGLKRK